MFKKILIANRGEIACRIIRTARRMGIGTVAVYSEADADSLHVTMADEAHPIGPAPATKSYLDIRRIVDVAKKTKADAVHPGFGFLAENAAFARALEKARIVFIGPPPKAIAAMGDKIESKKLAAKAGVNVIPGFLGTLRSVAEAVRLAREIGYPVMIKASAGGGGKGMRIARTDTDVKEGFVSAANEARASFGNDRVFIEKFIEEPRHIEIQVLADMYGNVIHLGERECSIQRRHQKVIEEAPSVIVDEKLRERMGRQAVALAKAVRYVSAGTVEFIVDPHKKFYFLEMNTRLQVEHPVTEMVTGLDLVEEMIRIAAGEKLRYRQSAVRLRGSAIEARVYAEDPARNFLPSTGRLVRYREPVGENIRVDSGVVEGSVISMFYDPMIAKLVVHGETRSQAIATMRDALDAYYIRGVENNLAFLASVFAKKRFLEGRLTTHFIEEEYPDGFAAASVPADDEALFPALAGVVHDRLLHRERRVSNGPQEALPPVPVDWMVTSQDKAIAIRLDRREGGRYDVTVGRRRYRIETDWQVDEPLLVARVNDRKMIFQVDRDGVRLRLGHRGRTESVLVLSPRAAELHALMPKKAPPDMSRFVLSPMPGLLVAVHVAPGQPVKAGEPVAVVEAMKMENILRTERDGIVGKLHAAPGDSLVVDQPIIEFE